MFFGKEPGRIIHPLSLSFLLSSYIFFSGSRLGVLWKMSVNSSFRYFSMKTKKGGNRLLLMWLSGSEDGGAGGGSVRHLLGTGALHESLDEARSQLPAYENNLLH